MFGKKEEKSPFKFRLADKVQDTITPFQGIVVARVEWYNGCVRYLVQPQELKDQVPIDPQWFDEAQVQLVEQTQREETQEKPPGGPNRGEPKSPV